MKVGTLRASFPKTDPFTGAFEGLPAIDFDRGRQMLEASDFSVPENWPHNWQWLVAMRDALIKAHEHEQSALQLRRSVGAFREMFQRGDAWPRSKVNAYDALVDALREARHLIHALRDSLHPKASWEEYEASSPQMVQINEALALAEKQS